MRFEPRGRHAVGLGQVIADLRDRMVIGWGGDHDLASLEVSEVGTADFWHEPSSLVVHARFAE